MNPCAYNLNVLLLSGEDPASQYMEGQASGEVLISQAAWIIHGLGGLKAFKQELKNPLVQTFRHGLRSHKVIQYEAWHCSLNHPAKTAAPLPGRKDGKSISILGESTAVRELVSKLFFHVNSELSSGVLFFDSAVYSLKSRTASCPKIRANMTIKG